MTRDDTVKLVAELKIAYPERYRGMNREDADSTVDLWAEMLAPYPSDVCFAASRRLIAESRFPPVIAELIAEIRKTARSPTAAPAPGTAPLARGSDKWGIPYLRSLLRELDAIAARKCP